MLLISHLNSEYSLNQWTKMHYLCGKFNLTVLVYSIVYNRLMIVDEEHKEVRGVLGRITNKLIEPNDRRL